MTTLQPFFRCKQSTVSFRTDKHNWRAQNSRFYQHSGTNIQTAMRSKYVQQSGLLKTAEKWKKKKKYINYKTFLKKNKNYIIKKHR
jgi:hypothetical protein